jgi:putative ABC transporter-associated repeat protein
VPPAQAAETPEPAPRSQAKPVTNLQGSTAIDVRYDVDSSILEAVTVSGGGESLDPEAVIFHLADATSADVTINTSNLRLPEGYELAGDLTLAIVDVVTPENGTVSISETSVVVLGSRAEEPRSIAIPVGEELQTSWQFDTPGRYGLQFTLTVPVSSTADISTRRLVSQPVTYLVDVGELGLATTTTLTVPDEVAAGDPVRVSAAVTPGTAQGAVEFYDGDTLLGHTLLSEGDEVAHAEFEVAELAVGTHRITAAFVPTWVTDFRASESEVSELRIADGVRESTNADTSEAAEDLAKAEKSRAESVPTDATTSDETAVFSEAEKDQTVLSAGNVAMTLQVSASQEAAEGTFDTAAGGLIDKTDPVYANQVFHSAEDTVIHLGEAEHDAERGVWSTPSAVANATDYTIGDAARLLLGVDTAIAPGGMNRPFFRDFGPRPGGALAGGEARLAKVTGADGVVTVEGTPYTDSSPSTLWDSSALGSMEPMLFYAANKAAYLGWTFTEEGRYCVSINQSVSSKANGNVSASTVYTFYVGDLPEHPTNCAQDTDGGEEPEPGETDPVITEITSGHTDVRVNLEDNELALAVGFGGRDLAFSDVILARTPPVQTVPEPTDREDLTAIGPVGTPYWFFPKAGGAENWVWPGVNTESLSAAQIASPITLTLNDYAVDGVRQPDDAEVVVMGSQSAPTAAGNLYFSSRRGLPQSTELGVNMHAHPMWAFTKQGVYCLSLSATARLADGHWSTTSGVLTMVVGDIDATDVQPCERQDISWPEPDSKTPGAVETTDPERLTDGDVELALYAGADAFDLRAQRSTDGGITAQPRNPDDLIIDSDDQLASGLWTVRVAPTTALTSSSAPGLFIDTTGVTSDTLAPQTAVQMTLGDVRGPGTLTVTNSRNPAGSLILSSAESGAKNYTLAPGTRTTSLQWQFSRAGVYCVPLTWSATVADGSEHSQASTLTFVVGSTDPASSDYVNRDGLTTCSRGQQATVPPADGGDDEEPNPGESDPVWDVPNGTVNEHGATILNEGHVDVASLIDGSSLVTKIKDTTESAEPTWRDPARTVLQLLPDAQTVVPSDEHFAFLGRPGEPVWQVTEDQQDGLLWPGWSTESIPEDRTREGVHWSLTDITGPGEFTLYTSDPVNLGAAVVEFNTRDGITADDSMLIPKLTHAHGTWAFSAEGVYCLAFERATTLTDGTPASDDFTLAFAVGKANANGVDPAKCFTEPEGQPDEADTTPIPLGDLNDGNAGGVQVLEGGNGFTAGQLVTVQVGEARADQWVSVWFDASDWLGWAQVDSSGAIQVRLPADAAVGSHVLVVKDRDGALIGWDSLSAVPAKDPGDEGDPAGQDDPAEEPEPEPDAVWNVANGTVNQAGATVLNNGHVDIASLVNGSTLSTRVKDTTKSSDPTWRDPAKTVLQLLPGSRTSVPAGSQWSFLGAAGASFYQVTQTAQPGLLWPGWSTESIALDATKTGVDWTLTDISGPGEFALYETGSFGQPTVLFSTRNGITSADSFTIPKLTHAHGSWAFSAQGNYCLAFDRSTTLATGQKVSDEFVLAVAVGRADVMRLDPAACFQKPSDEPEADTTPVPDGQLTEAARGGVKVRDGANGFQPGQVVSLDLPQGQAGQHVSGWLHSTPAWLGWETVEAQNTVSFRLPANAAIGTHRIVLKTQDGALLGWDDLKIVQGTVPEGPRDADPPGDSAPPSKTIAATGCVAGATILSAGHVDYASRIVGGKLESLIGDDTSGTKVYREPSGTILWLKPSSLVTIPAGYGPVGAVGSQVWQVPQTQNLDLIWLGWNTEALNAGNTTGPVTWTINQVAGPGSMKVYLSSAFGGVQQMVFNNGGSYQIPQGVHAHANWAFSAEGIYRVSMTQTVMLANGLSSSDTETLVIVVGDVDPATAAGNGSGCGIISNALLASDDVVGTLKAADQAAADAAIAAGEVLPGQGSDVAADGIVPPTALAPADPVPSLLLVLGALLMTGAAGSAVLWWRSRRRKAAV